MFILSSLLNKMPVIIDALFESIGNWWNRWIRFDRWLFDDRTKPFYFILKCEKGLWMGLELIRLTICSLYHGFSPNPNPFIEVLSLQSKLFNGHSKAWTRFYSIQFDSNSTPIHFNSIECSPFVKKSLFVYSI